MKRLKREEGLAAARVAVADGVQCKTIHNALLHKRVLDVSAVLVVTPTDMRKARQSLRAVVGDGRVIKDPVKNIGAIAAASETRTIVWLVPNDHMSDVVGGKVASLPGEVKSISLAARMLGGCIASEEWITACKEALEVLGKVPQPIARLAVAIKTQQELVVDKSVDEDAVWATTVLKKAGDSMENPNSKWIFRPARKAIKSDTHGVVLFSTEAAAVKDADDKTKAKDKIKRRKFREDWAPAAGKAAARKKVKNAIAAAKDLRGTGLSVEHFACKIAVFL